LFGGDCAPATLRNAVDPSRRSLWRIIRTPGSISRRVHNLLFPHTLGSETDTVPLSLRDCTFKDRVIMEKLILKSQDEKWYTLTVFFDHANSPFRALSSPAGHPGSGSRGPFETTSDKTLDDAERTGRAPY
jgi:hypothetical protein